MCVGEVARRLGTIDLTFAQHSAVEAAEALLDQPLLEDWADAAACEIIPLVIVTDNGPAMKSGAVTRWFAARPHLTHVRTCHRAPWTNGVVEVAAVGDEGVVAPVRPEFSSAQGAEADAAHDEAHFAALAAAPAVRVVSATCASPPAV